MIKFRIYNLSLWDSLKIRLRHPLLRECQCCRSGYYTIHFCAVCGDIKPEEVNQ
jgi:hypothetical protein